MLQLYIFVQIIHNQIAQLNRDGSYIVIFALFVANPNKSGWTSPQGGKVIYERDEDAYCLAYKLLHYLLLSCL